MLSRRTALFIILGVIFLGNVFLTQCVSAESPVQSTVETRLMLLMRVTQEELQKFVPAPWQVIQMPQGPFKGANLMMIFSDWILIQDAQGKPDGKGIGRKIMFTVPVKHTQSGEISSLIIRALTADIDDVPGPYKNSLHAAIQREHILKGVDVQAGVGEDFWEVKDDRGGTIELRVRYKGAVPSRAKSETKLYSSVDPGLVHLYRIDAATDVVKSVPMAVDRLKNFQFRIAISEFSNLFDGTEQIVGVSVIPLFVRQVFLP